MEHFEVKDPAQAERILARQTALELTVSEIDQVSGGLETAKETYTGVQCESDSCDQDL